MNWIDFVNNVQGWAEERGIYEHSTPEAQLLKALSELGELADAEIKGDKEAMIDAVGDVAVCIINYATIAGVSVDADFFLDDVDESTDTTRLIGSISNCIGLCLSLGGSKNKIVDYSYMILRRLASIANGNGWDFMDCCTVAWYGIKNRKGFLSPSGAFVKDE